MFEYLFKKKELAKFGKLCSNYLYNYEYLSIYKQKQQPATCDDNDDDG
ncbi:MAG: hypothetical protein ABFC18_00155 [Rikenellaceae bacterium]|jgi:hypothetical protein